MGSVRLTDGRELKIVTGIDDHSRHCVSAKLVGRATARPVCAALTGPLEAEPSAGSRHPCRSSALQRFPPGIPRVVAAAKGFTEA